MRHLEPLERRLELYARRVLREGADVEDTLQSALATAYRDFDLYAEGTNFRAWIFRYLNHEISNRNRSVDRRSERPLTAEPATDHPWADLDRDAAFQAVLEDPDRALEHFDDTVGDALRRLAQFERSALLLRALGEFSYREIAEILEIPVGSVMGYLSRARLRMRQELTEHARRLGVLPGDERGRSS